MEQNLVPGIAMVVLGLVGGTGILLAKADASSVDLASRLLPWARLFRYGWFRYLAASFCFLLSAVSLTWVIGWIG
jgi:hypothetical protein